MKTIYIDDDEGELKKYKGIFETQENSKGKFEIILVNAQKEFEQLIKEVRDESPQLILVDLKLEKPNNSGEVIEISGAPLSMALKEIFPDVPVVFFTKQDLFGQKTYSNKTLASVDATIYKNDIYKNKCEILDILYKFTKGFETLRNSHSREWSDILETINAPEDDYDLLKLSKPPSFSITGWSVSEAADWIINVLIKYPGILYDPIHAATFLGISIESFKTEAIGNYFMDAKYSGVFEPTEGRWWKSKLQELAESTMNEDDKDLLIREGFPLAWERISGQKLKNQNA